MIKTKNVWNLSKVRLMTPHLENILEEVVAIQEVELSFIKPSKYTYSFKELYTKIILN